MLYAYKLHKYVDIVETVKIFHCLTFLEYSNFFSTTNVVETETYCHIITSQNVKYVYELSGKICTINLIKRKKINCLNVNKNKK